jgi:hypothetical protein
VPRVIHACLGDPGKCDLANCSWPPATRPTKYARSPHSRSCVGLRPSPLVGQDQRTMPNQPRREPPSQPSSLSRHDRPNALARTNDRLRERARQRWTIQEGQGQHDLRGRSRVLRGSESTLNCWMRRHREGGEVPLLYANKPDREPLSAITTPQCPLRPFVESPPG